MSKKPPVGNLHLQAPASSDPDSQQIKFHQILKRLIEDSPYRTNRRPIWEAVHISSAALSQYTLGHARPRLETLVALAEFFGVTLDYLVLGREIPRPVRSCGGREPPK